MLAFAEAVFHLSQTDSSGISKREHLEQVESATGITPDELVLPDFPQLIGSVWIKFNELSSTRSYGMSGPLPITYSEIKAWAEVTGEELTIFEADVVKKIDALYVRIHNGG